jgi:DNA-binding response OmpR family regulator
MSVPLHGCRVLVIEDEYFVADEVASNLKAHGAIVVGPIGDLSEVQSVVRDLAFDVAILDINLRDEIVYPVADELMFRQIPFLFATGYAAEVIPERFQNVMRLEKPYNNRDLMQDVAKLCEATKLCKGAFE